MQQGTNEWHEWRRKGVGASESAAILGLCPYSTAFDVFMDKTGRAEAFEGNAATQRGQDLEGKARAMYELISMEDMPPMCAVHPKYDFLRASLDGLRADGKKILEIKCPGAESHEKAKAGIVPDHYMIQIQHQLAVTGADSCDYFSYSYKDGSHALVEVLPNLETQAKIVLAAEEFWTKNVLADSAPPLTDRDTKIIVNNPECEQLCLKIKELKLKDDKRAIAKIELDTLKAMAVALGGHPKIKCGDVRISTVNRNGKFSFHKLTINSENKEAP